MKVSAEEIASGSLTPETLQLAADQVRLNGYVVIERVLSEEKVQLLHDQFLQALENFLGQDELNREMDRIQMDLPFVAPFIDEDVVAHPIALSIIEALVGTKCACREFASETALPGSDYEVVHADAQAFFPDGTITLPVSAVVLNIPLVDFTEENGPLEVWPGGTHAILERDNKPEKIQAAAAEMQSKRVLMPAGSLLIRDHRIWHRDTPNRSNAARPHLALVYTREWYNSEQRMEISKQAYESLSDRVRQLFRLENISE